MEINLTTTIYLLIDNGVVRGNEYVFYASGFDCLVHMVIDC